MAVQWTETAELNESNVPVKIIVDGIPFTETDSHFFNSVTISTGCTQDGYLSFGCTYSPTCSVSMADTDVVQGDSVFEVYFQIDDSWENFGKFYVTEEPKSSDGVIEFSGEGVTAHILENMTISFAEEKGKIYSIKTLSSLVAEKTGIDIVFDDSPSWIDTENIYVPMKDWSSITTMDDDTEVEEVTLSARYIIGGLALAFGGNAIERNGKIHFCVPGSGSTMTKVFTDDTFGDAYISRNAYIPCPMTLTYQPYSLSGAGTYLIYISGDKKTYTMQDTPTQGEEYDKKYSLDIECDWIARCIVSDGWHGGTKAYRPFEGTFFGYHEYLAAGNFITVLDENGEQKEVFLDSVTYDWDGALTVSASSSFSAQTGDASTNSSTISSSSGSAMSASEQGALNSSRLYVRNFTSSNAFIEKLTANEAFIDNLTANEGYIKKLTSDEAFITNLTAQTAFIDNLTANLTAGSIAGAVIKDDSILGLKIIDGTLDGETKIADASITYEKVGTSFISDLTADEAFIDTLKANIINADYIKATTADIGYLTADSAEITDLTAGIGDINTLIFGSATGNVIQTNFANSVIAQLGDAQIKSAMIDEISADKITSGSIKTNLVDIVSESGNMVIKDNTIQIKDDSNVRVQIGKDANNDYSINIWDADGKLMFSEGGITEDAVKNAIIRDDMVSESANISAEKINIGSLFDVINKDGSHTLSSNKIYVDADNETLDVSFKNLTTKTDDNTEKISSQGTEIEVLQGKFTSKIWKQDITSAVDNLTKETIEDESGNLLTDENGEQLYSFSATLAEFADETDRNFLEMSTQYSELTQDLSEFKSSVGETYALQDSVDSLQNQIDGAIETYTGVETPTLDNYPANEWTDENTKNIHIGDLYYVQSGGENQGFCYRFQLNDGEYEWVLLKDSEITKAIQEATEAVAKANQAKEDAIADTVNRLKSYSTTSDVNSMILQSKTDIKSEVSATYTTKLEFAELEVGTANKINGSKLCSFSTAYEVLRDENGELITDQNSQQIYAIIL